MTPQDKITLKKLNRLVNARMVIPLVGFFMGFILFVIIGVSIRVNFPDTNSESFVLPVALSSYASGVLVLDILTQRLLKANILLSQSYSEEIQTAFYQMHDISLSDFRAYLRLKKRNRLWIPLVSLILLPLCWIPYIIMNFIWFLFPTVRAITPKAFRSQPNAVWFADLSIHDTRHPFYHINRLR